MRRHTASQGGQVIPSLQAGNDSPSGVVVLDARIVVEARVPSADRYDHMAIHPYPSHLVSDWQLADGTDKNHAINLATDIISQATSLSATNVRPASR